ncbi:MAG: hypothetical protein NTU98_06635 [Bacteroidetes bacterium]|nr:hypothetical protein [Bacteroidota bacterium]
MKKIILFCLSAIVLSMVSSSCSKDNSGDDLNIYVIPSKVVSQYLALAFSNASSGINWHLENISGIAASGAVSFDSTYTLLKTDSSSAVNFHYVVDSHYFRGPTNPPEVTYDYTASGSFNSATIYSADQHQVNWAITGLDQSQVTFSGTGGIGGQQHSYGENANFTSHVSYTFHDVMTDKLTSKVKSGTATISVTGMGPGGVNFAYSGTLTFLGNRQATLVFEGSTYNFSLDTGVIQLQM